jgi:hypothetical protein
MARRVFIGNDFEEHTAADNAALMQELFGPSVVGGDLQIVGNDLQIVGQDDANKLAAGDPLIYEQWLPLTVAAGLSIAAGATVDVELKPQRTFRPGDLTLSAVAQVLHLSGLSIGGENQFVASGAIPCEIFSKDSTSKRLKAQTANRGTSIILTFTNTTAAAVVLSGVWAGDSVVR